MRQSFSHQFVPDAEHAAALVQIADVDDEGVDELYEAEDHLDKARGRREDALRAMRADVEGLQLQLHKLDAKLTWPGVNDSEASRLHTLREAMKGEVSELEILLSESAALSPAHEGPTAEQLEAAVAAAKAEAAAEAAAAADAANEALIARLYRLQARLASSAVATPANSTPWLLPEEAVAAVAALDGTGTPMRSSTSFETAKKRSGRSHRASSFETAAVRRRHVWYPTDRGSPPPSAPPTGVTLTATGRSIAHAAPVDLGRSRGSPGSQALSGDADNIHGKTTEEATEEAVRVSRRRARTPSDSSPFMLREQAYASSASRPPPNTAASAWAAIPVAERVGVVAAALTCVELEAESLRERLQLVSREAKRDREALEACRAREAERYTATLEVKESRDQIDALHAALEAANATQREMAAREARTAEALRQSVEKARALQAEADALRPLKLRAQESANVARRAAAHAERLARQKETLEMRLRATAGGGGRSSSSQARGMGGGGTAWTSAQSGTGVITHLASPFAPPLRMPKQHHDERAAAIAERTAATSLKLLGVSSDLSVAAIAEELAEIESRAMHAELEHARSDARMAREEASLIRQEASLIRQEASAAIQLHSTEKEQLLTALVESRDEAAHAALDAATATAELALQRAVAEAQAMDAEQDEALRRVTAAVAAKEEALAAAVDATARLMEERDEAKRQCDELAAEIACRDALQAMEHANYRSRHEEAELRAKGLEGLVETLRGRLEAESRERERLVLASLATSRASLSLGSKMLDHVGSSKVPTTAPRASMAVTADEKADEEARAADAVSAAMARAAQQAEARQAEVEGSAMLASAHEELKVATRRVGTLEEQLTLETARALQQAARVAILEADLSKALARPAGVRAVDDEAAAAAAAAATMAAEAALTIESLRREVASAQAEAATATSALASTREIVAEMEQQAEELHLAATTRATEEVEARGGELERVSSWSNLVDLGTPAEAPRGQGVFGVGLAGFAMAGFAGLAGAGIAAAAAVSSMESDRILHEAAMRDAQVALVTARNEADEARALLAQTEERLAAAQAAEGALVTALRAECEAAVARANEATARAARNAQEAQVALATARIEADEARARAAQEAQAQATAHEAEQVATSSRAAEIAAEMIRRLEEQLGASVSTLERARAEAASHEAALHAMREAIGMQSEATSMADFKAALEASVAQAVEAAEKDADLEIELSEARWQATLVAKQAQVEELREAALIAC